jgi:hypothetical protein
MLRSCATRRLVRLPTPMAYSIQRLRHSYEFDFSTLNPAI